MSFHISFRWNEHLALVKLMLFCISIQRFIDDILAWFTPTTPFPPIALTVYVWYALYVGLCLCTHLHGGNPSKYSFKQCKHVNTHTHTPYTSPQQLTPEVNIHYDKVLTDYYLWSTEYWILKDNVCVCFNDAFRHILKAVKSNDGFVQSHSPFFLYRLQRFTLSSIDRCLIVCAKVYVCTFVRN